jgi:hypothetical protein
MKRFQVRADYNKDGTVNENQAPSIEFDTFDEAINHIKSTDKFSDYLIEEDEEVDGLWTVTQYFDIDLSEDQTIDNVWTIKEID